MMQKGFILLLIIWNSCTFASGKTDAKHLQFPLGCQAVIPCQHSTSDSNSFQWNYKKDEHSLTVQIFFQDKTGVERHQKSSHSRLKVLRNRSLVIDSLTEGDEGLYWCENCFQDKTNVKNCQNKQSTVFNVKKEILKETYETYYVTAGSSFTHACPGEQINLEWTFEASHMSALNNSVQGPELYIVASNKSMYILNVKRANAGKYSCWTSGCDGHRQKLLIINLCVIIVHNSEDSSVSCDVMCDLEFSNITTNSTSNVETGTMTKSVFLDPYGSLNCSAKQMFEGYSTVNSTHGPSDVLNKTTGITTKPEYLIPVIYGTLTALTCLILMALLICYLRPRMRAAFPVHLCCCSFKCSVVVEEEASVVYSSVVIRRPATTTKSHITHNDCIYSEIKV